MVSSRYPWSVSCVEAINRYPEQLEPGVCGNYKPDPSSAVIAVRNWPGPIYFSGLGDDIRTGGRLHETSAENPVRRVHELYLREKKTRPSWDLIGVLIGVRSEAGFWKIHTGGYNHIFENGTNQWREGPETNHRLVKLQTDAERPLRETLDQLMVQAPRAK